MTYDKSQNENSNWNNLAVISDLFWSQLYIFENLLQCKLYFCLLDCASWRKDLYKEKVWANNTGPAVLKWRYDIPGGESFERILCGYTKKDGTLEKLVAKNTETGSVTVLGRGSISSNIEAYTETSDSKVVGFRITRVEKSDPKSYICNLVYKDRNSLIEILPATVHLVVFGKWIFTGF